MKRINLIVAALSMLLAGFLLGAYFVNHIDGLTFTFTFATALFCGFLSISEARQ